MDLHAMLSGRPLLVLDGAMGTRLMELGLPPGASPMLWNAQRPEVVEGIHRDYLAAGADCVLTNTFGGNPFALARHGLRERTDELNRAAVELARRAAGDRALVLADVGPTGALLEPWGELAHREARGAFLRQVRALAEPGPDAFILETFQSVAELRIALEAARECTDLPLMAGMSFAPDSAGRHRNTMGEGPAELVRLAGDSGCSAVGTNCGQGIQTMPPLVERLAGLTDLPVFAEPNAGMPRLVDGAARYREDPAVFREHVPELYEAGARLIGGCDGTTAEHVRVIREFADSL